MIILFSGGSLGICKCQRMRGRNARRTVGGEGERRMELAEEGQAGLELKEVKEIKESGPTDDKLRFGEVKMEIIGISDV